MKSWGTANRKRKQRSGGTHFQQLTYSVSHLRLCRRRGLFPIASAPFLSPTQQQRTIQCAPCRVIVVVGARVAGKAVGNDGRGRRRAVAGSSYPISRRHVGTAVPGADPAALAASVGARKLPNEAAGAVGARAFALRSVGAARLIQAIALDGGEVGVEARCVARRPVWLVAEDWEVWRGVQREPKQENDLRAIATGAGNRRPRGPLICSLYFLDGRREVKAFFTCQFYFDSRQCAGIGRRKLELAGNSVHPMLEPHSL